jgi:hypothetical protein
LAQFTLAGVDMPAAKTRIEGISKNVPAGDPHHMYVFVESNLTTKKHTKIISKAALDVPEGGRVKKQGQNGNTTGWILLTEGPAARLMFGPEWDQHEAWWVEPVCRTRRVDCMSNGMSCGFVQTVVSATGFSEVSAKKPVAPTSEQLKTGRTDHGLMGAWNIRVVTHDHVRFWHAWSRSRGVRYQSNNFW